MRPASCLVSLFVLLPSTAAAESSLLHEPIFTETVTDIDADDGGELEIELNAASTLARTGPSRQRRSSLELEYRATRALGFLFEPGAEQSRDASTVYRYDLETGVAVGVLRQGSLHLQLEGGGRLGGAGRGEMVGEAGLPAHADARSAFHLGDVTVRSSFGAEAGGASAHAPLRASLAALAGPGDGRFGFVGVEVEVDGARRAPYGVAGDFVADLTSLGVPFRVGVGLPLLMGAPSTSPSFGAHLRLFWVSARELAAGSEGEK